MDKRGITERNFFSIIKFIIGFILIYAIYKAIKSNLY